MSFKNVAIIGASGTVGSVVLPALIETNQFNITIITSKSHEDPKLAPYIAKGVKVITAQYDDRSSLVSAFRGQDVIISTVGNALFLKQIEFIDAAVEAGVPRFIPSEFGGDLSLPINASQPILGHKVAVRRKLEGLAAEDKIEYTYIVTGPFLNWGLSSGFLGFDLHNKTVTLFNEGKHPFNTTHLGDVGRYTAAALLKPAAETKNQSVKVATTKASQNDILEAIEKVTGSKFSVKARYTTEEVQKLSSDALSKGDMMGFFVHGLHSLIFSGNEDYTHENHKYPLYNQKQPLTLQQTVEEVVQEATAAKK